MKIPVTVQFNYFEFDKENESYLELKDIKRKKEKEGTFSPNSFKNLYKNHDKYIEKLSNLGAERVEWNFEAKDTFYIVQKSNQTTMHFIALPRKTEKIQTENGIFEVQDIIHKEDEIIIITKNQPADIILDQLFATL